jgi:hypothetical protein
MIEIRPRNPNELPMKMEMESKKKKKGSQLLAAVPDALMMIMLYVVVGE